MKAIAGMAVCAVLAAVAVGQDSACIIISEVVDGTLSGGCPKWIEITNTGTQDYVFPGGGIIVQMDDSIGTRVDVDLTGVVVPAGGSIVVNSNQGGICTGAFHIIYGFPADINTNVMFGDGNDRYILTDTNDGSHFLDIYGEFGVNGTGRPWEYTEGYAYRLPQYVEGNGGVFVESEWFYGGPHSLWGENPEELVLNLTHPRTHDFSGVCCGSQLLGDANCDGLVNAFDIDAFVLALTNPSAWIAQYGADCDILCTCDCDGSGEINAFDIDPFVDILTGA
jgi:hypothetical protein